MASLHYFFFAAIVAAIALFPSQATALKKSISLHAAAPSELIESACKSDNADDYNFCIRALSCPKALSASNPKALTKVVLTLAAAEAKATYNQISALLRTQPSPALGQCLENYKSAMNSFNMVAREVKEDPMTANYDIKVNTDLADECDRALAAGRVFAPRITEANQSLRRFAMIGFQVTNLLQ